MKLLALLMLATCLSPLSARASSSSAVAERDLSMRIAVVGAGAAGLTAAHELMQLGYRNITVFEREQRVGGKVFSYRNGTIPIELGAFWAGVDYPVILSLAKQYGVSFVQEDADFMVRDNGQIVPMWGDQFLEGKLATLSVQMIHANWLALRFHKDLWKIGFADLDPELHMTFTAFAEKYHIEALGDFFRPFWIGCGYSDYNDTPAIYVLRFMIPLMNRTFHNVVTTLSFKKFAEGAYRFPLGYMAIFERIAATMPDVRLGAAVTKIERIQDSEKWRIRITAGDKTEEFDRLIVSTDLQMSRRFLDLTPDEDALFSQVTSHQYRLYLLRDSGDSNVHHQVVMFDQPSTVIDKPRVVFAYQRKEFAPLWVVGQSAANLADHSLAYEDLVTELQALNVKDPQLEESVFWNYFPRVTSEVMASGFFDKLERLQGERGTFYVGSALNFETVETTAAYAQDLVRRRFGD